MLATPSALIAELTSLAPIQQAINSYLGMLKGFTGVTLFLERMSVILLSIRTLDLTKTHAANAPLHASTNTCNSDVSLKFIIRGKVTSFNKYISLNHLENRSTTEGGISSALKKLRFS
ncbi:hypothetical protein NPIL_499691 [Nephila pilipes]|uniref:Uncharacterized protein n=1 Tax=Nephila pilipes TaxID=299642 RepID=A0A8X6P2X8_NEPPI|nr:hypothetical protein NPIL_499691 [Nephila pilipes]